MNFLKNSIQDGTCVYEIRMLETGKLNLIVRNRTIIPSNLRTCICEPRGLKTKKSKVNLLEMSL